MKRTSSPKKPRTKAIEEKEARKRFFTKVTD